MPTTCLTATRQDSGCCHRWTARRRLRWAAARWTGCGRCAAFTGRLRAAGAAAGTVGAGDGGDVQCAVRSEPDRDRLVGRPRQGFRGRLLVRSLHLARRGGGGACKPVRAAAALAVVRREADKIVLAKVPPGADPDSELRQRGDFLDLRTLTYALTCQSHSLESACNAFGVRYSKRAVEHGQVKRENIAYCREDVQATAHLYRGLAAEYERWGLLLAPTRAYSSASLVKARLREAGIRPVLQRQPGFPNAVLGYAMTAYFGGRAECRVLRWLGRVSLEQAFGPRTWSRLRGLVLIEPKGDIVPVRTRYSRGDSWGIGVNPLTSSQPVWVTLPEALAATLLQAARRASCGRSASAPSAGRPALSRSGSGAPA